MESVDSIHVCRHSVDTQYMIVQEKISPILKNGKFIRFITIYHPFSSIFMTNKTPGGREKHLYGANMSYKCPSKSLSTHSDCIF